MLKDYLRNTRRTPRLSESSARVTNNENQVSVILPVFNHGQYLDASIQSVLVQENLLELIIVNDGSTEELTLSILKHYANHPMVTVINQDNAGVAAALNRGFFGARGNLLSWTSADNLYKPHALQTLSNFLLRHPEVALTYGNVELLDHQGLPFQKNTYRPENLSSLSAATVLLPMQTKTLWEFPDNFINACFLYRRSGLNFVGPYRSEFRGFEDYDYWLRLSFAGSIAHCSVEAPLYQYRIHSDSLTKQLSWDDLQQKSKERITQIKTCKNLLNTPLTAVIEVPNALEPYVLQMQNTLHAARIPCRITSVGQRATASIAVQLTPTSKCSATLAIKPLPELDWQHSSHAHWVTPFSPALIGLTRQDGEFLRSIAVAPLVQNLEYLQRARDHSFGACEKSHASLRSVLVFSPTYKEQSGFLSSFRQSQYQVQIETLTSAVQTNPQLTFVLFCKTAAERRSADLVNQTVKDNSNLRIIDCSTDSNQDHALLYVCSSVDAIYSYFPTLSEPSHIFELWVELLLAAHAGVPLLLHAGKVLLSHAQQLSATDHHGIPEMLLLNKITEAPHLVHLAQASAKFPNNFVKSAVEATLFFDSESVDSWLRSISLPESAEHCLSFMLCP